MIVREFMAHKERLEVFVERTVNLIMQRLSEQAGHKVRCVYPNDMVEEALIELLEPLAERYSIEPEAIAHEFVNDYLPGISIACQIDAERYQTEDPALENLDEVFYASNGFWATVAYRIANGLLKLEVPIIPRAISAVAHSRTGVDIHPGATIEAGLFIDHGTGIAIGCTTVIHANVNLYNGVVLGTRSKPRKKTDEASATIKKRHPTIESNVSLYTNAFVGGDVVIGSGTTVGAYAFVCHDVSPDSVVLGKTSEGKQAVTLAAAPVMPAAIEYMI